ncbi:tetratricopeptide repeat protein [Crenothrix sp.]|uniref:tetratricopeptide repeat protein n=1 Tax=Crenothrix sp. TaxID=3100433 RepID=UPI00374D6731
MKNKKNKLSNNFALVMLGLLSSSSLSFAANFDALEQSQSSFDSLEQSLPENAAGKPSILNSLQQSEVDSKKDRYFAVLNLLKQNKLNEASTKIDALLKQSPNESQFHNLQALLEMLKKNPAGAQQSYQKAVDLDKSNLAAQLGLAKLALDAGELNKAKDYADKVLAVNNKLASVYLMLANIAYKQKNTAEVERILQDGHEKVKGNLDQEIELVNTLGRLYVLQKQPEKLLVLVDDMVKRHNGDTRALSVLAGAQIVNTQTDLAEQTLKQIIKQNKSDINHRLLLIKVISEKPEKEKEVLQILEETSKIDANNPQADVYKAAYFIKLKRNPEALAVAENIEKKFPKLAIGKLLKGDVFLSDKQWDKAVEQYQKVYKIEPNTQVLFKIADILQSQNKLPEAITLLDAESIKDNANPAIHFKLATLYQQQNNLSQAQLHYEAILNQQADNPLALNNLAWLYSQQNNPKSLELAKKAYALAPDAPAINDTYGYVLLKQGQTKEALNILEKATVAAPKDNDMQFHLAQAHVANDGKQKAIEILENITKSEQDFSEKSAAQKLLGQLKAN